MHRDFSYRTSTLHRICASNVKYIFLRTNRNRKHKNIFCIKMVLVRPESCENTITAEGGHDAAVKVKTPKRILHFCDGTLEEYSTDEDEVDTSKEQTIVDPSTLTWGPWFWYKTWAAGTSTLSVMDSIGEFLASLFGITTPRYYFELEEYKRREQESKKQEEAAQGWSQPSAAATTVSVPLKDIASNQPKPVEV